MGYRSEIGCLITCPVKVSAGKIIQKLRGVWGDDEDFNSCFKVSEFSNGEDRFVYVHADWLKWYDGSYDDVTAFMEFIRSWEDRYQSGGVHYVRIGESLGDVEEEIHGDPQQYINVYSTMEL